MWLVNARKGRTGDELTGTSDPFRMAALLSLTLPRKPHVEVKSQILLPVVPGLSIVSKCSSHQDQEAYRKVP
jgi:hypothetical protein